jgi:hypothetical protein
VRVRPGRCDPPPWRALIDYDETEAGPEPGCSFVTRDAREVGHKGRFPFSTPSQTVQQALIRFLFRQKPPWCKPGGLRILFAGAKCEPNVTLLTHCIDFEVRLFRRRLT